MPNKPSMTFSSAYAMTVDAAVLQLARHEAIRARMTAGAISLVAALAVSMTAAPAPAQAQNQVQRAAGDVLGGVIGGAIGSQIGGGRGRKAAEVAGVAAGVWAAESIQGNNSNNRYPNQRLSIEPNGDNFGPSGWNNAPGNNGRVQRTQSVGYTSSYSNVPLLQSGNVPLTSDRAAKLGDMERSFLSTRDNYARAMYSVQQLQDDLVLSPSSKALQQEISAAEGQKRTAENEYNSARQPFVEALEYLGARGYDVHQFAYSYQLTRSRVGASDMKRSDLGQAVHFRNGLQDVEQVRGESYNMR